MLYGGGVVVAGTFGGRHVGTTFERAFFLENSF